MSQKTEIMTTVKVMLRNKPTKENKYPIVLRVTKNRKSKLISLGYHCDMKDWDKKKNTLKKSNKHYIQINVVINKELEKAYSIINDFRVEDFDFTLDQFVEKFNGKSYQNIPVSEFWNEKIEDLITAGRTGNARAYKDTYNSFFKFHSSKSLLFRELTPILLDKYETHLKSNGNSGGGIGVKMRAIRALYNDAIKKGVVNKKYYPFNDYKVSKHKSNNVKKALTRKQVRLIENLDLIQHPHLVNARNYFVFSYYSRGMNFMDMLKLKWDNIKDDRIEYTRSKTKKKFSIKITESQREILNYYLFRFRETHFVFPILLKNNLTPTQVAKFGNSIPVMPD